MGFRRYLAYGRYVHRHKLNTEREARRLGIGGLGLFHDLGKFSPLSFVAYARHFYAPDGTRRTTPFDPLVDGHDRAFLWAYRHHTTGSRHHFQHYVVTDERGNHHVLPMPEARVREMVADWAGVAATLEGSLTVAEWWAANRCHLRLHPDTAKLVDRLISESYGEVPPMPPPETT